MRTQGTFKMKQKAFFIISKGLSIKQITQIFVEGESTTSIFTDFYQFIESALFNRESDVWNNKINGRQSKLPRHLFRDVLWKKDVLKNLAVFTEKHLCLSLFLIKLQAFRIQHRSFPVNIAKVLRTPVLENICGRFRL